MQLGAMTGWAVLSLTLLTHPVARSQGGGAADLEKSAYFAFVDHDYIYTLEVVSPGVPILNFVSMTDASRSLPAKQVRIRLENRTAIAGYFLIDTGDPKEPISAPNLTMRPRSSFGVRIKGDFDDAKEFYGVTVRLGDEDFKLAPLTSLAFENLVLKINRINLGSPDFKDDWQALKLEVLGSRAPVPRRGP